MDWTTGKLRTALVLFALSLAAGCQTDGGASARLLPLFALKEESPPIRRAFLGAPIVAETDPHVTPVGTTQTVGEKKPSPGISKDDLSVPESRSAIGTCFTHDEVINLNSAFRLADIENPTIRLSDEVVRINLAEQMLARALLFPTLNVGATVALHHGSVQNSSGRIIDTDRNSLYFGAGADVRAAGTPAIPGLLIVGNLGEAVFAPRVARQRVVSSRFDAAATRNNILLSVATNYLGLVGAEASLLAYRQSEAEYAEIARITANFAAKGQGREADAQRARSQLLLLQNLAQQVEEDIVFSATELSRLLNVDPSTRLRPEAGAPPFIQLVDQNTSLEVLVETAIAQRPEVAARSIDVNANEIRLRQERVRPLMPTLMVGVSSGDFGGGSDVVGYRFSHFNSRTDIDAMAFWTLQNLGAGNLATQKQARSLVGQSEAVRQRVLNQVQAEVAEALARTKASRIQMEIARRRVETSQRGFQQDLTRAKNNIGHPIEVLNSLNLLTTARQDLVRALVEFSQSQFQLYVAIGGMPGVSSHDEGANP